MAPTFRDRYQMLIADDDSGFREALCEMLMPHFELVPVSSGEEAIEIVEYQQVDIALLDMHMSRLSGLETSQILKSYNAIVPCILITADANDTLRREAAAADIHSVLQKPVSKTEILATVKTALVDTYNDPAAASWLSN